MQPEQEQRDIYAKPARSHIPGQTVLLWVVLVVLVVNLVLTAYVFGVVHHLVSAAQSVGSLFSG